MIERDPGRDMKPKIGKSASVKSSDRAYTLKVYCSLGGQRRSLKVRRSHVSFKPRGTERSKIFIVPPSGRMTAVAVDWMWPVLRRIPDQGEGQWESMTNLE